MSMDPKLSTATRIAAELAATWQQREAEMLATIPDEERPPLTKTVESPRSAAIARCRRELASAFGLPEEER